jgi:hypothetical protein
VRWRRVGDGAQEWRGRVVERAYSSAQIRIVSTRSLKGSIMRADRASRAARGGGNVTACDVLGIVELPCRTERTCSTNGQSKPRYNSLPAGSPGSTKVSPPAGQFFLFSHDQVGPGIRVRAEANQIWLRRLTWDVYFDTRGCEIEYASGCTRAARRLLGRPSSRRSCKATAKYHNLH